MQALYHMIFFTVRLNIKASYLVPITSTKKPYLILESIFFKTKQSNLKLVLINSCVNSDFSLNNLVHNNHAPFSLPISTFFLTSHQK